VRGGGEGDFVNVKSEIKAESIAGKTVCSVIIMVERPSVIFFFHWVDILYCIYGVAIRRGIYMMDN
jgi:hypothetical protein